jgi:hypothetical protein
MFFNGDPAADNRRAPGERCRSYTTKSGCAAATPSNELITEETLVEILLT